jgi:hypothetical protein
MSNSIHDPGTIGSAFLESDGTLKLDLHQEFDTRYAFHKLLTIYPDNPRYRRYLEHLGDIQPGERKRIPAWPRETE